MSSPEELSLAARQLFRLGVSKEMSESDIRNFLQGISSSTSSKLTLWSKVWARFGVKEQDMINIYRKQKQSFQRIFDTMKHRLQSNRSYPQEEREVLSEMEQLLASDDLLLNSTHVILILRSMKYLKDKKNELTKSSSTVAAAPIDRYRYISIHLIFLLQLRLLLNARSIDGTVIDSMKSIAQNVSAMAEKYKPLLDLDISEKNRVQSTTYLFSYSISRVEDFISKGRTIESDEFWWCGDIQPIVDDMIMVQRSAAQEKMGDSAPLSFALPFAAETMEEEKSKLSDLLEKLTSQDISTQASSFKVTSLENSADVRWLLGNTEFCGFIDDLVNY